MDQRGLVRKMVYTGVDCLIRLRNDKEQARHLDEPLAGPSASGKGLDLLGFRHAIGSSIHSWQVLGEGYFSLASSQIGP